ncbi:MAG: sigma-70 family RNA polymerase sigma factor [Lentisphaerae bacterium]|nr:sigma-70 family RNA polymerase sigma factor [Lentisphaerota bacterium]
MKTATIGQTADARLRAFEETVSHYEAALLRYAARVLRNPDAAQDVVQEAFLRLFERWKQFFEPGPQLSSWLYRVTHNCAVDHLRKEQRRGLLHTRQAREEADFAPPDRGEAFRLSEAAERAAAALKHLSLREQQLVILKIYEGLSYKEIGAISGLSVGNVGYILHHAMRKMAAELKEAKAI